VGVGFSSVRSHGEDKLAPVFRVLSN